MDDKFLYQNRPLVRSGFSESLYARISKMTVQEKAVNRAFRTAGRFALACLLLFAVLLAFSRPVQAGVLGLIEHIAGFVVEESVSAPVIDQSKVTVYWSTPQVLSTALKDLSFTFTMPSYIPDGFVLSEDVGASKSWIQVSWVNESSGEIVLSVQQNWDIPIGVGVDSTKEVKVNGQSAVLIQGWWDTYGKWDHNKKNLQLYWRKDGLIYILQSMDPSQYREVVSEDELIRIAESIR